MNKTFTAIVKGIEVMGKTTSIIMRNGALRTKTRVWKVVDGKRVPGNAVYYGTVHDLGRVFYDLKFKTCK